METWMLFRKQDCSAHYFWNGEFPILVQVAAGEEWSKYYWDGTTPGPVSDKWIREFNEIADSKKRVFQLTGHSTTFVIVKRGVFETE